MRNTSVVLCRYIGQLSNTEHVFVLHWKQTQGAAFNCSATCKVLNVECVFLQVSFLREVLQWDPGGERDVGRWSCTATNVSKLTVDEPTMKKLNKLQFFWQHIVRPPVFLEVVKIFLKGAPHVSTASVCILFFSQLLLWHFRMISKDQFERKKNDVLDPEP